MVHAVGALFLLVGFASDMASTPISLIPETQDLRLYGGDGVRLRLIVTNSAGEPINLTGSLAAQVRSSRTISEIRADFTTTIVDAVNGIVELSLTGDQTAGLHGDPTAPVERFLGVWDIQWTAQDAEPVTILQGAVESNLDVTRL